jgi:hypothetical protein
MSNITIKNVSTATIILTVPELRMRKELIPGRVVGVSEEEYRELNYDVGFTSLVKGHYIKVSGVDEETAEEAISQENVFSKDDIGKMFDTNDITSFAKFIPTATAAEKEAVVNLAVSKGVTSPGFVALIKKYCDVDIISAINIAH